MIDGVTFVGRDLQVDPSALIALETNDCVRRRYGDLRRGRIVDVLVVFSAANRKGTHPPEVCLSAAGANIVRKRVLRRPVDGAELSGLCELITQRGGETTYHLYVYKCGRRYATSFLVQQARIFLNGLISRNASGALIHLSVPVLGQDVETARRLALTAIGQLMPRIEQRLP